MKVLHRRRRMFLRSYMRLLAAKSMEEIQLGLRQNLWVFYSKNGDLAEV